MGAYTRQKGGKIKQRGGMKRKKSLKRKKSRKKQRGGFGGLLLGQGNACSVM